MTLVAFHGKKEIKATYLGRVKAHAKADEIVSGQYWENGKGCAVGCTLHNPRGGHAAYESELGIPMVLARLEDRLFEAVYTFDPTRAKAWPARFLNAPSVGADLTLVWPKFSLWLLMDENSGVIRFVKKNAKVRKAIEEVGALYERWVTTGIKPEVKEWNKVRVAEAEAVAVEAVEAEAVAVEAVEAEAVEAEAVAVEAEAVAVEAVEAEAVAAAEAAVAAVAAEAAVVAAVAAVAAEIARLRRIYGTRWYRFYYYRSFATETKAGREHYVLMSDKLIELMSAAK